MLLHDGQKQKMHWDNTQNDVWHERYKAVRETSWLYFSKDHSLCHNNSLSFASTLDLFGLCGSITMSHCFLVCSRLTKVITHTTQCKRADCGNLLKWQNIYIYIFLWAVSSVSGFISDSPCFWFILINLLNFNWNLDCCTFMFVKVNFLVVCWAPVFLCLSHYFLSQDSAWFTFFSLVWTIQ